MRKKILISVLVILGLVSLFSNYLFSSDTTTLTLTPAKFNHADVAWMLVASVLVFLMTPGVGFFYGGMVNSKNIISTIFQSFIAMVTITVLWFIFGFGLAFGPDLGGIIGNPIPNMFMRGVGTDSAWPGAPTIPILLFALFQLKFAIITPALISGGVAERIRFWGYLLFIIVFSIFIYSPLAHATWHPEGILAKAGVLDFAGGTVVHMSSGWAAFAGAIFLKKRRNTTLSAAQVPYVILGASLLWVGWFGFNAGSSFAANGLAVLAFANTTAASAVGAITWGFLEKINKQKLTSVGVCVGAVVGLVGITPAAGYVSIGHSLFIGLAASIVSFYMVRLFHKKGVDDTLDVFPCHGVGGMVGMLLTGVFADKSINEAVQHNGLFYGETTLFVTHFVAMMLVSAFAFFGTLLLLYLVNKIIPLRVDADKEELGLDISQHGEKVHHGNYPVH
ncbi:ammonium transporter [Apibacter raozihei]|uniref:ammonium transporter n=1 Tax=Apibacter raozihei TaxID=2500547 RepID=UPI000FE40871|nr:ammonium transporter [Apibacter raozihei]